MELTLTRPRSFDWWWTVSTCGLTALWLFFIAAHVRQWHNVGRPVGLGLLAEETVVAALFVLRRRARVTSRSPLAWLAAIVGTFGALALRPTAGPVGSFEALYVALQLVGAGAAVFGLWSLGRSFGVVAANRGIQTGGPYRLVRHPIYAGYLIATVGYLLENPSLANFVVELAVWAFQLIRIAQEERLLSADPMYAGFRLHVRYRLVPFVY